MCCPLTCQFELRKMEQTDGQTDNRLMLDRFLLDAAGGKIFYRIPLVKMTAITSQIQ